MRLAAIAATVALSVPASAAPQAASPYLPIRDWTTPYVEHLIRAGVITEPSPLTRPLRRSDVLEALRGADTSDLSAGNRETVRKLIAVLAPREAGVAYRGEGRTGVSAATQLRRDPLRPTGDGYTSYRLAATLEAAFGPVAASVHPFTDPYLRKDPDYTGNTSRDPPGRLTDAYVSLQGRYGELFLGAVDRNWGPTGTDGLLTSSYPYSYDHLYGRVGTKAVRIEALATQLDDFPDPSGQPLRRYWMSSRVLIRPWPWLTASFDNATLWYGIGRGFELRYLNPLKLSFITLRDDDLEDFQNSVVAGELWVALPRGIVLQGVLLLDAISSGLLGGGAPDPFPDRFAATGTIDMALAGGLALRGWGSIATAFMYRAPSGVENSIMLRGVGLGRNYADYLETGISLSGVPLPMTVVEPEIVLLRQGEGDFRLPTPPLPVPGPRLFDGVVETTWRLGLRARTQLLDHFDLDGDAGWHFIRNAGHQPGVRRSTVVARAGVTLRFGLFTAKE